MSNGASPLPAHSGVESLRSSFRDVSSDFPDVTVVRSLDDMQDDKRYWRISVTHEGNEATLVCDITALEDGSPFIDAMVGAARETHGGSAYSITDRAEVQRRGFLST